MYNIVICPLYTLQIDHLSKSSYRLPPYKVNIISLTMFSMLHITFPWLTCLITRSWHFLISIIHLPLTSSPLWQFGHLYPVWRAGLILCPRKLPVYVPAWSSQTWAFEVSFSSALWVKKLCVCIYIYTHIKTALLRYSLHIIELNHLSTQFDKHSSI